MIRSIQILDEASQTYMSHRLRANVQFQEIDWMKELLKRTVGRVLVVNDQKQKILPIKCRDGQVEYYGKKV